jgi:hypothetical protein
MNKAIINFGKNIARRLPDDIYLQLKYRYIFGKKLDLKKTETFSEKLQWLKLNNKQPIYTTLVDKYEVKKYVSQKIGKEYVNPTLGVYDSFDEIDFDSLPQKFVLKVTHDSGGLIICKDKSKLNIAASREKIEKSLKTDFFVLGREWPYKNVKPRIIVENYMEDESGEELKDYKIFCFNGQPKIIQLDYDRFSGHHRNMYNTKWEILPFAFSYSQDKSREFSKPKNLDEMLCLASELSKDMPFVRCDFYSISGKTVFGEMTFFPESGFGKFDPPKYDRKFGEWINLSK